ncbi:MAG: MmgE/PrpD family protein [Chloroflexi bacterium]|nr:MmgE/PrpD family protein [Chloroflexota bacterium]
MGVTGTLASLIVGTSYEAIPPKVVGVAKDVILDGVGVTLAGSREPLASPIIEYIQEMGGTPQCSVAGWGSKSSPLMAAFANGVFCHALDFEVMWHPATHPTSPTLPALLAMAEVRGSSGREVIEALVAGFEVQARLRLASGSVPVLFHPPGVVGPLGSAAACARLLGLDVERTRMALGMAASRAGSLAANIGSMTKSTHCGNAARMGLEAALLAEKGFTANEDVIEAYQGFAECFMAPDRDLEAVVRGFGDPYRMVEPGLAFKKYPCQYGTHRGVDAALELRRKHHLRPQEIEDVQIRVPPMDYVVRPFPATGLEGKFSFQYTVAAALLDGQVVIESFTDGRRFAPDMEELLPRIRVVQDPAIPANFEGMWTEVTVRTSGGRELAERCDRPRGIWGSPLSHDELLAKFRNCAGRVLFRPEVDRCAKLLEGLERLPDVRGLMDLVRARVPPGRPEVR